MKHMERQKHGASLSGDDDDDDEGSKAEDEDLAILQSALDVLRRSGDGAGPSIADRPTSVAIEEGYA
jgi:hypothetical protein